MGPRYPFRILRLAFRNLYFLMFLNGFLLASLFYFKMESFYEDGLFASIKSTIDARIDSNDNTDSLVVKAMGICYHLLSNKGSTFNNAELGPEADVIHSTSFDLMTTRGACGSYSQVLARILKTYHIPVRIAQMKADGHFGAHNLVEAKVGDEWVVLDPTYNLCFHRPDSKLADFSDVHGDWAYYSKQVPPDYNPIYRYEAVRYTNWTKIPIISPAARSLLSLFIGRERTDTFSLRTYFMNTYQVYVYVLLLLYIPLLLITMRGLVKTKIFPSPEIPVTIPNVFKYLKLRLAGVSSYTP
ncbi:MAG TPA: transglutaminase domain-containing protein [Puia sp.]|nr:transglutaminase domain-containing protein [Puia sp.]